MDFKCPKCGNNLGEFDVFCSKCGAKITKNEVLNKQFKETQKTKEDAQNLKENANQKEILNRTINNFLSSDNLKKRQNEFFNPSAKEEILSNPAVSFGIFVLIVAIIFAFCISVVLQRQANIRMDLKYKNYINNPNLIPEFHEVKTYDELENNFSAVNDFLELYLKHSSDTRENKDKIFTNYLQESQKVAHITSENVDLSAIKECSTISTTLEAKKNVQNI